MIPTKEQIERELRETGNVVDTAKKLGVGQKYIKKMMERYGINRRGTNDIAKSQLEKAIADGMGIKEMSVKFNTSVGSIHRLMKKYGLKSQIQSGWEERRQKYIDLLKEGLSNEQIAAKMNVSEDAVRNYINKHNLKSYRKKKPDLYSCLEEGEKQKMLCRNIGYSKTKRKCLYGGHCGNSDCCDYMLLTGKRREYDKGNPEMCFCFVYASEATKKKLMAQRQEIARDIMVM